MLIFIAGVHGVGKSYLCTLYCKQHEHTLHKSASQLIREFGNINFDSNKLTSNIDENQLVLIEAIKKIKISGQNLLLDGHFALVDKNGEVNQIDSEVFKKLELDGIILLEEPSEIIKERINARDKKEIEYNLEELITQEKENANKVSLNYQIPLIKLLSPNYDDFQDALGKLACKSV
ncbi:ATP-binding protein [Rahnella aceris]|uniref:ATP-binding protein n=1 Tax=Rahnella sp. (strain Y9602) TaxID=2703885 RepID=UPI003FCF9310